MGPVANNVTYRTPATGRLFCVVRRFHLSTINDDLAKIQTDT
jgi:hypothetical protein